MVYWKLAFIVSLLIPSVGASDWDDFASNLAADLAPLITLFGNRLTKQFLSESICVLDNFIFALAPLGILTAVVSVIRVCGNPSLKAFVGRAQEGPGDAELELLPCVSETTAELFNEGGISRVFGRPRVLEVFAWEKEGDGKETSFAIGNLRDAISDGAWCPRDDAAFDERGSTALDIPNLSLNKGIKRRDPVWSYCAAVLGCLLQAAVLAYSALTVFGQPGNFKKKDTPVPAYAFPFFVVGTVLLSTGMFFCAFIIKRSSREYYFSPTRPSKVFWLQPGRQSVGDQVIGAFMGVSEGPNSQPTRDLTYVKSLRSPKEDGKEGGNGKQVHLLMTVLLTMLGFLIQFVGLRGLHASVIVAQIGATLLMSVVRACLRTKRIDNKENQLREKRDLTSHNQQELDYFAFHLENIESFDLVSSLVGESLDSQYTFSSDTTLVAQSTEYAAPKINIVRTRTRLAELTSGASKPPNMAWDDMSIRNTAQSLARSIEMAMDVLSSWGCQTERTFDFNLVFRCQPPGLESGSQILEHHIIRLERSDDTLRWRANEQELEAILGLWTWSLLNSNQNKQNWLQNGLFRLVGLDESEAATKETDLCFHKWVFRQTQARMVSSKTIHSPHRLFGYSSDDFPGDKEILAVKTQNGLGTMAAQDLYIRFLGAVFENVAGLGGTTDVLPGAQNTFFAQNTHLDELVTSFESGKLGSREDALLCIAPVLGHQSLLPELAADSPSVRKRIERSIDSEKWEEAFSVIRWLCERSDGAEFERSVFELGSLCRRAMLHGGMAVRQVGYREVCSLLKDDPRAGYFEKLRHSRRAQWMSSREQADWWSAFSQQLGWMAWHISNNQPNTQHMKSTLESLGTNDTLQPPNTVDTDQTDAARNTEILLQWLTLPDESSFIHEFSESDNQSCFQWTLQCGHFAVANWLLIRWAELGQHWPLFLRLAFGWAAASPSESAIQTLCRHGGDINGVDKPPKGGHTALLQAVGDGDELAARRLLENGADANSGCPSDSVSPLMLASLHGDYRLAQLLISYGASPDLRDWSGSSALSWAARKGRLDVLRLFIGKGAYVDASGSDGMAALLDAASNNHVSVLEFLLDSGADVDMVNENGRTALTMAAQENSGEAISLLLRRGANAHQTDLSGMTALDWAKACQHQQPIALLESALGF
ncbi:ankyrin repeat-containing protein [Aspergillus sp. HF37]|nr:ankyrin repeat-containing protein [Aspergillus sp. HF37]